MTKERKQQIYSWIKECVARNIHREYKLFVFGSQANREILSNSDIDLGIDTGFKVDDRTMSKIWNELDNLATLYTFDLIDFQSVDEKFKEVASKNIEILHNGI